MKLKKIITILMTIMIVLSTIITTNTSMATYTPKELKIEGGMEYSHALAYHNARLKFVYSYYINEKGNEQPVYGIDKTSPGVETTETKSYTVTADEVIEDARIWRILHHSYPYVSITDMGCDNKYQCYVATKAALYCVLYDWDVNKYKAIVPEGDIIIKSIKNLMNYANNETIKPNSSTIEIEELTEWNLEELNGKIYLSRNFIANNKWMEKNYTVSLRGYVPIGSLIVGIDNKEKREFGPKEQFKILIPRDKVIGENSIQIEVNSELSTFPIYKGVPTGDYQAYAITGMKTQNGQGAKMVSYNTVGGTIIINKLDSYTNEKLAGAVFNVYDKKDRVIDSNLTTDKNGQIKVFNLPEGEYFVEEIKEPKGYQRITGKHWIPVFNKSTSRINVMNTKTQVKEEEIHNVVVEVVESNSEITNKTENDYYKYETNNKTENNIEINNTHINKENNNQINNEIQNNTTTKIENNNDTNNDTHVQNNVTTEENNNTTNEQVETNNDIQIQNNISKGKKLPKTGM